MWLLVFIILLNEVRSFIAGYCVCPFSLLRLFLNKLRRLILWLLRFIFFFLFAEDFNWFHDSFNQVIFLLRREHFNRLSSSWWKSNIFDISLIESEKILVFHQYSLIISTSICVWSTCAFRVSLTQNCS